MIGILPYQNRQELDLGAAPRSSQPALPMLGRRPHLFCSSGRAAMAALFRRLGLRPEDEVFVTNSTDQVYVSSCVTCTIFNFCKPSRVLTDAAKAIFIIHEYGLPHPNLLDLVQTGRRMGIPVIEDCAHGFDSRLSGRRVGEWGDYTIYSLSKLLPVTSGGILVGDDLPSASGDAPEIVDRVRREWELYEGCLEFLSRRRRENFQAMRNLLPRCRALFELTDDITPAFLGLYTPQAAQARRDDAIEWGATLQEELLLAPTNPMVSAERMAGELRRILNAAGKGC